MRPEPEKYITIKTETLLSRDVAIVGGTSFLPVGVGMTIERALAST